MDFRQFEQGDESERGGDTLGPLQERLARLQLAQIVHRYRSIVLFEGWEGSGKRSALQRLTAAWDPCYFATHNLAAADDDRGRHWLARYWNCLPGAGAAALFQPGWYRHLVEERALGRVGDRAWARRCDEINEFEAQQRDHGTVVVKLFFHVTPEVQAERLAEREADPWRRLLVSHDDRRIQAPRDAQHSVWANLFANTDTRWAPWIVIDANDRAVAQRAALSAVAEAFEKVIPLEPPGEGDKVVVLGQQKAR